MLLLHPAAPATLPTLPSLPALQIPAPPGCHRPNSVVGAAGPSLLTPSLGSPCWLQPPELCSGQRVSAPHTNCSILLSGVQPRSRPFQAPAVNSDRSFQPIAAHSLGCQKPVTAFCSPGNPQCSFLLSAHPTCPQTYLATIACCRSLPASLHTHTASHAPAEQQPAHALAHTALAGTALL